MYLWELENEQTDENRLRNIKNIHDPDYGHRAIETFWLLDF